MRKIIVFVMCLAVLLSACQPTPETAAVQSKSGSLIDMISGNYEYEPENAAALNGQTWSETIFESDDINIIVDAEIMTQNVEGYPAVRVKRNAHKFLSPDFLGRSIDFFFDGGQPYYRAMEPGKKECEMYIIRIQQMIASGRIKEDMIDSAQASLEYFKKAYMEAPEDIRFDIETDPYGEKYKQHTGMESEIALVSYPVDGLVGISIAEYGLVFLRLPSLEHYDYEVGLNSLDDVPESVSMDAKAALKIAEDSVKIIAVGEDMRLARVATINGASTYETDYYDFQDLEPTCLVFYYMRGFGDVEPIYIRHAAKTFNAYEVDGEYGPRAAQEYIRVVVDDLKIVDWMWLQPDMTAGVISKDVPLMPFEQIKDIFRQQVNNFYSYVPPNLKETINIDRIVLSLMKVAEKDNNETSLVIPVWDFVGTLDSVYEGMKDGGDADYSFLTINAIDGSIIDRNLGY